MKRKRLQESTVQFALQTFFGYNKDLKLQYRGRFRELKDLKPVSGGDSDLKIAMKMISETQAGPKKQIPSMGCNIKWFN